ncbi:MAG: ATP-binding protein, partial [Hyphomicrobiales bacterium]
IDLRIEVPAVTASDLIGPADSEPSDIVGGRVAEARKIQEQRFLERGVSARTNAQAPASIVEEIAQPDDRDLAFLRDAAETFRLSARGYHRVLKLARTLADLDGLDTVSRIHLAEALSYRGQDISRRAA